MAISTSGYTGAKETVVVIDSGWSSAWSTGNLVYQQDFLNGDADAKAALTNTHGALVTADILQHAPDVGIIELKVLPDDGSATSDATIEKAFQWVVANADAYNVVGVNFSLAGGSVTTPTTTSFSDEIAALAAKKILTVAAGGNAGSSGATQDVSLYAADPNVVCVSASTGDGQLASWAQASPTLTSLCADGTDVRLTNLAGQTYSVAGSSFAAPTVTAALALAQDEAMQLRGSRLSLDEFEALAKSTGTAMQTGGYTELNVDALLAKIAQTYGPGSATTAGASTIVVNAQGTAAGGVNAHFNLLIDGVKVGEGTTTTTAKDFAFTTTAATGVGHKVQVQYDNDAYVSGQDRNLIVNKVTIGGHTVAPTDGIVSYDKGALDGKDVIAGQSGMWWGGTLVVNADKSYFPASGSTTPPANGTIVVNAQGTAAGGVNAHFNVLVDGVKVGSATADTIAKDFAFTTDAATGAGHKVQVQYDNDAYVSGQDRNLIVNKVTVGGHAHAPTESIVTYDKGALDGKDVIAGQSGMWWGGTLVVNAPATDFPAVKAAMLAAPDEQTDLVHHLTAHAAPATEAADAVAHAMSHMADHTTHAFDGIPVHASFDHHHDMAA